MGAFSGSSGESSPGQGFPIPETVVISRVTDMCLVESALKTGNGADYGRFETVAWLECEGFR